MVNLMFKDSQGLYVRVTALQPYKGSYKIAQAHYMVDGQQPDSSEIAALNERYEADLQYAGEQQALEREVGEGVEQYYYRQIALHFRGN